MNGYNLNSLRITNQDMSHSDNIEETETLPNSDFVDMEEEDEEEIDIE